MNIDILYSKIQRATVTDTNLDYVGSITIDRDILEKANMYERQKVDIVNVNNGERFSTYIISGEKGEICINGAASRKAAKGDTIIIIAYASIDISKASDFLPNIVFLNKNNEHIKNPTMEEESPKKEPKLTPSKLPKI